MLDQNKKYQAPREATRFAESDLTPRFAEIGFTPRFALRNKGGPWDHMGSMFDSGLSVKSRDQTDFCKSRDQPDFGKSHSFKRTLNIYIHIYTCLAR